VSSDPFIPGACTAFQSSRCQGIEHAEMTFHDHRTVRRSAISKDGTDLSDCRIRLIDVSESSIQWALVADISHVMAGVLQMWRIAALVHVDLSLFAASCFVLPFAVSVPGGTREC
jgi:hypothetical protein